MPLPQQWGSVKGGITKIEDQINAILQNEDFSATSLEDLHSKRDSLEKSAQKIKDIAPQLEALANYDPSDSKTQSDRVESLLRVVDTMIEEFNEKNSRDSDSDSGKSDATIKSVQIEAKIDAGNKTLIGHDEIPPPSLTNGAMEKSSSFDLSGHSPEIARIFDTFLAQQAQTNARLADAVAHKPTPPLDNLELLSKLADALQSISAMQLNSSNSTRLPTLTVPQFSGDFSQWNSFRDMYVSVIHSKKNLSKMSKLQYLLSYLEGDAKGLIENIDICEKNYDAAWQSLINRYEDSYALVDANMRRLIGLPALNRECPKSLSQLHSTVTSILRYLKGKSVTGGDLWVIHIVYEKLDSESKKLWARIAKGRLPTWEEFDKFLIDRVRELEMYSSTSTTTTKPRVFTGPSKSSAKASTLLTSATSDNCKFCGKGSHKLYFCHKFRNPSTSSSERLSHIKKEKLCRNCITEKHMTNDCQRSGCKKCGSKHNTLLHDCFPSTSDSTDKSSPDSAVVATSSSASQATESHIASVNSISNDHQSLFASSRSKIARVFLGTAIVKILDQNGDTHMCRAVVDNGSQCNLITGDLVQRLKLHKIRANFGIGGILDVKTQGKFMIRTHFGSRDGNSYHPISCNVVTKITGNVPNWYVDPTSIPIPAQFVLADPTWNVSQPIDLLIGGGLFARLENDESHRLGDGMPKLKHTELGWILVGEHETDNVGSPNSDVQCGLTTLTSIDNTLKRFFEHEEVPKHRAISLEQKMAEEIYTSTTKRLPSGAYEVQLPFKSNIRRLESNLSNALAQFKQFERRTERNPERRAEFNKVFSDYDSLGFREPVPPEEIDSPAYYMPFHGVIKEDSATTKLRIVYNASSKSSSGLSLNDTLFIGPVVQSDLVTCLLHHRRYAKAGTCDITKMYPHIPLYKPHRNFQRILGRNSPDEPIGHYRLTGVCFGVAASPFLATRTVNQAVYDEGHKYPIAAPILTDSTYVDNSFFSVRTLETAIKAKEELIALTGSAGFKLAQWGSNCPELLDSPSAQNEPRAHVEIPNHTCKALGMTWNTVSDDFEFDYTLRTFEVKTKRCFFSAIACLFDPLGLVAPVIVEGKRLLQESWKILVNDKPLGWDDPLPPSISVKWISYFDNLKNINVLKVPRWISDIPDPQSEELHMFSDASMHAYGACVYIVTTDSSGNRSSCLLISKSRIAPWPSNSTTIARLELCAAVLGANLIQYAKSTYQLESYFCWTDSEVVIKQINATVERFDPFVGHRISEILSLTTSSSWRHVRGHLNPADIVSRGATPQELQISELWWQGPSFIRLPQSEWSSTITGSNNEEDIPDEQIPESMVNPSAEHSTQVLTAHVTKPSSLDDSDPSLYDLIIQEFSDYREAIRKLAHLRRFLFRKSFNIHDPLSVNDLNLAEKTLIGWDQRRKFAKVYQALQNGTFYTSTAFNELKSLSPYIDEDGLLRVGGRLSQSQEPHSVKHQLLLPKGDLAYMIAKHEHKRLLHAGPQLLLSSLRQKYWPIRGGYLVRNITKQCVRCVRVKPQMNYQLMADLPAQRVTDPYPFRAVGVDFAGPAMIRHGVRRNSALTKAYICVFVCLSTKAVHCEVVSDLTTQAFLACLRRFVARRSLPNEIFSDNGKNFVGAEPELSALLSSRDFQEDVKTNASAMGVQWHFTPPRAPHHGGLWEAAVKSFKHHFKREIQKSVLNFEELTTITTQIEGILNSRPITTISEDPSEDIALTPAHFLVGKPLTELPSENLLNERLNVLDRWQLCQRITQEFCKRWKLSYLTTLQQRTKWQQEQNNLRPGDVVAMCEENSPSFKWPLARVVEVHPGRDNRTRVVTVKTSRGTYTRPITMMSKLPIEGLPPSD